jgi:hypothetical protein
MTDDRFKTESAGRLGRDCREVARRAGVAVGGVRACRSIILAEPGAAGFAGIAAFRSLLPKEAGFGVSKRGPRPLSQSWSASLPSHHRGMALQKLAQTLPGTCAGYQCRNRRCKPFRPFYYSRNWAIHDSKACID